MIEYDSDTKELERMMKVMGGGSNPEEGDGVEQEDPPNVMEQPESHKLTSLIEVLEMTMLRRIPPMLKSSKSWCRGHLWVYVPG